MFDIVHKHKRAVQVVLALITLPFAFFGVDYYFRGGDNMPEVARVGKAKVTQQEFADALRDEQERMRAQMGANFDPSLLDNPEVRFALLEQIINQKLLEERARKDSVVVNDAQLQQVIGSIEAFQQNGRFSPDKYREFLAARNLGPLQFEQRFRRELQLAPITDPLSTATIVTPASQVRYLDLLEQQREVATATIPSDPFAATIKVDDAAAKAFYDANPKRFQSPEQARFEYVILTPDAVLGQVSVDPNEVKAQYEANRSQYGTAEERSAAHILIAVKPDAKPEEREAAKKKAEEILAKVKANPASFAELAKQYSQDPGSASRGGDLGQFPRGTMVKPFDDAVFGMKVGDIVGPVASDFGYHIIKLEGIVPAKMKPFDEVRAQIENDLRHQKSGAKFAAAADQFQNLVYEQADSLQGVAKALNIPVQTSALVTREQAQQIAKGNAKFVDALFSPDSVQGKRNTEAMEIAPNTLMAGRIVEYKPATPVPFDQVKEQIRRELVETQAAQAAQKEGEAKLAALAQGKSEKDVGLSFGAPVKVSRSQSQPTMLPDAVQKVFRADPTKLPQYVGASQAGGDYAIYKITQIINPPTPEPAKLKAVGSRLSDQLAREMYNAYVGSLKAKSEIKINQANLEKR